MENQVMFVPSSELIESLVPPPKPAKMFFPDWLKEMPNTWEDKKGIDRSTATQCMPFMDTFLTGYIQELPCDVGFSYHGKGEDGRDNLTYRWAGPVRPLVGRQERDELPNYFPKFDGYYYSDLQWLTMWEPQTPKGYSTIYHHPLNRFDLPFNTFNGIIDTDKWPINGPLPFMLKEGFEGVIPAGTPMYQITFIKRDFWKSSVEKFDANKYNSINYKVRKYLKGGYKKAVWSKKVYT